MRELRGRQARLGDLSTILGAGLLMLPPLALVMIQPDLGTSLVFGAILVGKMRGRKKVLELISSRTPIEERQRVFELLAMPEVPAKAAATE